MSEFLEDSSINKPLPHSSEAEDALLSAFFLNPESVGPCCAARKINNEYFYLAKNAVLFNALMAVWERGATVDFATVSAEVGDTETIGGVFRIHELCAYPTVARAPEEYLDILCDRYLLRGVRTACKKAGMHVMEHGARGEEVMANLLTDVGNLATPERRKVPSMKELVEDKMRRIQSNEADKAAVRTGLRRLDEISPLRLGGMPLLTGERKAGKSILALNIAMHIAEQGGRVLYIPLEEPAAEVVDRMMARKSSIPILLQNMKDVQKMNSARLEKLQWAAGEIAKLPMTIRDDLMDLSAIVGAARLYKARHADFTAMFVDYAQLVRVSLGKGANREQEVAYVSRTLRQLGRELHVAMVVLCQLNKDGEARESKALEQDCTAMWKLSSPTEEAPNERLLVIPFQRSGESNIACRLAFFGAETRVEDLAPGSSEP